MTTADKLRDAAPLLIAGAAVLALLLAVAFTAAYVAVVLAKAESYDTANVWAALDGYRRWEQLTTAERDAVARELAAAGYDHARIADRTRTTYAAVAKHCERRGIASAMSLGRAA